MSNNKLSTSDYPGFENKPEDEKERILKAINKRLRKKQIIKDAGNDFIQIIKE